VHDLIHKLADAGCLVSVQDPELTRKQVEDLGFTFGRIIDGPYDCIVAAVPHKVYKDELTEQDFIKALKKPGLFYDLKSIWNEKEFKNAGVTYLSL
jgi:UDP-N-acetyl-D-mannosaminuronate dehydrogenase